MPRLVFKCPETSAPITTDVVLDDHTLSLCGDMPVQLGCSCGFTHAFKLNDGRWDEPAMPPFQARHKRRGAPDAR